MTDDRKRTEVKQQAKADLDRGKEQAKQKAREVKERGKERVEEQAERAASGVDDLADAVESAASRLSELEHQGLADYASQLATSLGDMSGKLRDKNVDELAGDVRTIAHRNPALFVLGSIAVGIGLSRFAKAKSDRPRADTSAESRGDDEWAGFGDEDFISDSPRANRDVPTDRNMTPDQTGGSGL